MSLPETWQLPGRAGGNSWSPWGRGDPTANRHGKGPLQEGTGLPRCGMVWADWRSRQAREAQPFANPISQGYEVLLGRPAQPSPAGTGAITTGPRLPTTTELTGAAPLPRLCSRERLLPHVLRAHRRTALRSRQPAARPGALHRQRPPQPGLGVHLAGNAMPWRDGGPGGSLPTPNTLCRQQCLCALQYKPAPLPTPAQHPPRGAPAPSDTRGSCRNGRASSSSTYGWGAREHPRGDHRHHPLPGLPAWQGMLHLEHHIIKNTNLRSRKQRLEVLFERTRGAEVSPCPPASGAAWSWATGSIPG